MTKPKETNKTPEAWRANCKIRNKVTEAIAIENVDYQSQLYDTKSNTISKKFQKYIKGVCKDCAGNLKPKEYSNTKSL